MRPTEQYTALRICEANARAAGSVDSRGPGDVQHLDFMPLDELAQSGRCVATVRFRQVEPGLTVCSGQVARQSRAAGQLRRNRENRCSVRVAHVPLGSLGVFRVRRFLQFVTCLDCAILSQSSLRAPTVVRDAMFDGKVQRRAVHARLPAGNDFLDDETR